MILGSSAAKPAGSTTCPLPKARQEAEECICSPKLVVAIAFTSNVQHCALDAEVDLLHVDV